MHAAAAVWAARAAICRKEGACVTLNCLRNRERRASADSRAARLDHCAALPRHAAHPNGHLRPNFDNGSLFDFFWLGQMHLLGERCHPLEDSSLAQGRNTVGAVSQVQHLTPLKSAAPSPPAAVPIYVARSV